MQTFLLCILSILLTIWGYGRYFKWATKAKLIEIIYLKKIECYMEIIDAMQAIFTNPEAMKSNKLKDIVPEVIKLTALFFKYRLIVHPAILKDVKHFEEIVQTANTPKEIASSLDVHTCFINTVNLMKEELGLNDFDPFTFSKSHKDSF